MSQIDEIFPAQSSTSAASRAMSRAMLAQLHPRMLFLSVLPSIAGILLWGGLLWWGLEALFNFLQNWFATHDLFRESASWLAFFGATALKTVIVPIIAVWGLLPLIALTTLIFIGLMAMPTVVKHVATRDFPNLERKQGGTLAGSVWVSLGSALQFTVLWILTLPFCLIPFVAMLLHPLLLGWLSYRVMSYDCLSEHASAEELQALKKQHRSTLIIIGSIASLLGGIPGTVITMGGALMFPFLAVVAIWLYAVVFIFTGLWFEYYCLNALQNMRRQPVTLEMMA